jgi:hypothetical protein
MGTRAAGCIWRIRVGIAVMDVPNDEGTLAVQCLDDVYIILTWRVIGMGILIVAGPITIVGDDNEAYSRWP